ncbi:MAG: hypothetical protein F4X56_09215 [Gammaproteobacteria bacterium]|nr:hypothetical protein [Gammaproteobacteria bacterium]
MNTQIVWCIARHEMRGHRRLIRTHVFIWVALVLCAFFFLIVSLSHVLDAVRIAMLGVISPRYVMSLLGGSFLALFCIGVLLLTFDQVKRDEINLVQEVIHSKPISNFELFLGRLIGTVVSLIIPAMFFLVSVVAYGIVAETFSFQVGEPVEIWSVVSFAVFDIVPNFLFFGSLLILLCSAFKSRLLSLIIALCCVGGVFWLNSRFSLEVSRPLQTVVGSALFPSELIPTLFTPVIVINRLALLLMAIGFLYWASILDMRETTARSNDLLLGSASFCGGVLLIVTLFIVQIFEHNRINEWVKVHNEHFKPTAFPDVLAIRGTVEIKPGRTLVLDLTLDVRFEANQDVDFVLFSLNPGYKISHLSVAGTDVSDREFQHGLLKIPQHHFTVGTNEIKFAATGRPNKRFAYLDSRATLSQIVGPDVRQLRQLGTENFIFRSEFVALLPGIKWYPTSGTATNEHNWEHREKDFFTLDIAVSVPQDWIVAGPAKRESLASARGTTYQFRQTNPLPEFALVGSKFESAAIEVEGIVFEVLYSRAHRHTFEALAPTNNNTHERLQAIVQSVRSHGFQYPYDTFALVEVPSTLRVFGGGYRMDSVMSPAGLVMIRESTLPTISVNSLIDRRRKKNFVQYNMDEDVWIDWQFQAISQYLQHPMFESNVNLGFFRSLILDQTHATQEGALALNNFLEHLIEALFPNTEASFDFQLAINRNIVNIARVKPIEFLRFHLREGFHTKFDEIQKKKHTFLNTPIVWDTVKETSLYDSAFSENDAQAARAIRLRSHRLVELMRDTIGTEKLAQIGLDLLNRFRGRSFELSEFIALFEEHGVELDELGGDLTRTAGLPGFIGSNLTTQKRVIEDTTKFETTFLLKNGEPVSGPVKLAVTLPFLYGGTQTFDLQTMVVERNQSVEISFETLNPVRHVNIKPYLSLNHMNIRLDLPQSRESQNWEYVQGDVPILKSVEVVTQPSSLTSSITVDDLDQGFSIVDDRSIFGLFRDVSDFARKLMGEIDAPQDHGLMVYQLSYRPKTRIWSRWTDPTAFGIYRRTFAISEAGNGSAVAKFSTTLPQTGSWQLEYFLPKGHFFEDVKHSSEYDPTVSVSTFSMTSPHPMGTFHLTVLNGTNSIATTLEASNLSPGWQTVGSFDLTENGVDVLVSNKTDKSHMYVLADAIRWTPVETEE